MTTRRFALATGCCLALAAVSLLAAHEPVYDAWAWLVWGRELATLELDTSSGPSWKPLTVALTAVLSLAGDAAPDLWLLFVRTAWLLALVLAAWLAYRLAGGVQHRPRLAAGAFAAVSLLLLADSFTAWPRQGAAGMSEPLLVALALGAVAAGVQGRSRTALALAGLAALVRPEVWPLLAAYGLWRWRAEPRLRVPIAALAFAVPALWLGPDLLASGGTSAGARALQGGGAPLHEFFEVFGRVAAVPLLAAWPLALFAVACARGPEHDRALPAIAAGAAGWIAIVALMAAAGFPGLPRFMAPAVAVVCVLAGVGLARLLALVRPGDARRPALAALVVVLLVTLTQLPGRAAELAQGLSTTARIARSHDRLRELAREVGRGPLLRCGALSTSDVLVRTALAWELRVGLSEVVSFGRPSAKSGAFVVGPQADARLRAAMPGRAALLGARGEWRIYSIGCPPAEAAATPVSSGRARSAGVSGARR